MQWSSKLLKSLPKNIVDAKNLLLFEKLDKHLGKKN